MDAISVIRTKRDRGELSPEQIDWVIDAYTRGEVADEQMSALAMAILLNGMNRTEIARWTAAMIASGERMDFGALSRPTTDKHSTGGVGDKITLPLAPLVAACGAAVPQLSGRGLGHTGGTLDKLESIPGWRAHLSNAEMLDVLDTTGAVICAALRRARPRRQEAVRPSRRHRHRRGDPADRQLDHVQEDRRGHRGARPGRQGRLRRLHEDHRGRPRTGLHHGRAGHRQRRTDGGAAHRHGDPLGLTAGNALEVRESVEVLAGGGPQDVIDLTLALAREMLDAAGLKDADPEKALADGSAMDVWRRMISAQGGDPDAPLPVARERHVISAPSSGVLTRLDAYDIGVAAWRLGAGRARKEDPVQAGAGVELHAKPGDTVTEGQPLLTLHTDTPEKFEYALKALPGSYDIAPAGTPFTATPVVRERIA